MFNSQGATLADSIFQVTPSGHAGDSPKRGEAPAMRETCALLQPTTNVLPAPPIRKQMHH